MDFIQQIAGICTFRKCFLEITGFARAFDKVANLEIEFILKRFIAHVHRYSLAFNCNRVTGDSFQ
jgi:hypothetical protein